MLFDYSGDISRNKIKIINRYAKHKDDYNNYFKLGMIGCGGISHAHARAISEDTQKIRFTSCCSRNEQRARDWAEKYNCQSYYTDYVQMCENEDLDGVLLATWPTQHFEQIIKMIDTGIKNILCEKALTITGQEASNLANYARKNGVFLTEGFMYRHNPAIRKLDEILNKDADDEVDSVRAVFNVFDRESASPDDSNRNWRQRPECGGGVVYDLVCYCVNAINHFCGGQPAKAYAIGGVSEKYHVENRLYGLIQYNNGRTGIIESSKKSLQSQELQITCSDRIIHLPVAWTINQTSEIKVMNNREWAQIDYHTYLVPWENSYRLQLLNFVNVAQNIEKPVMPIAESVVNTYVIEALVKSLKEQKPVEIHIE